MHILRKFVIFSLFPLLYAFPFVAFAACAKPDQYELIMSIGTLSGCVDLGMYLNGIFQTTIGIAGIIAVIMIVFCGIRLMGSPSASGKSEAKECIWNAIFGVLIAVSSWVLLNTINPLLLANTPSSQITTGVSGSAVSAPYTEPDPTEQGKCYFKYTDLTNGDTRFSKYDDCATCELLRNNFQANTARYKILSTCYPITSSAVTAPPVSTTPPVSAVAGSITCPTSGLNLCEGQYNRCANPRCAAFAGMAAANAGGVASAELIKAIILQESSCGIALVGDGGQSCGPMHIKPETANRFLSACNISQPVTCGWLTQPENFNGAICLGAEYLRSLSQNCGTDVRDLAAGYNGGSGACNSSVNCNSDTNCAGNTPPSRWECLYDDNAHQQCNVGYQSARNYATRVLYCTQNPGY